MAKPKILGQLEVRELSAAFNERERFTLVKRLISGQGWNAQRVEFSLVLSEEQVSTLAAFMGETYSVDDFGGL